MPLICHHWAYETQDWMFQYDWIWLNTFSLVPQNTQTPQINLNSDIYFESLYLSLLIPAIYLLSSKNTVWNYQLM